MNGRFEMQPTLAGELVLLRPLLGTDYEDLRRAAADPLIWEQHPIPNRWRRPNFDAYFGGRIASGGSLVAIDRSSAEIIGASSFLNFEPRQEQIEVGASFLARQYWGGAYNGEMKRLMINHAFRFVENVVFAVSERNFRSQTALEKIGARRDHEFLRNGIPYLLFKITKRAWMNASGEPASQRSFSRGP